VDLSRLVPDLMLLNMGLAVRRRIWFPRQSQTRLRPAIAVWGDLMERPHAASTPWGSWATAGLGLVVVAVLLLVQVIAGAVYTFARLVAEPGVDLEGLVAEAGGNGTLLSVALILSAVPCGLLVVLFAWLRTRNTGAVWEYLALQPVSARALISWVGAALLMVAAADTVTLLLGRPVVPEFMASGYRTVVFKPLFWFALCLVAPVVEEIVFRGFLFAGFERSKLGPIGTVIVTSLSWTAVHVQYGFYELTVVLLFGLVLGAVRARTASVVPTVAVHVTINIVAAVEAALLTG